MSILKTVTPVSHDLGSFEVRRAVPSAECRMVGPFVFVDQFGPAQLALGEGMDVRPHPHINLATVTWLFEGAIDHRDSLGTFSTIRPVTVNLMTAGSGIVHSERSPAAERAGGPKLYGMQTWLALPEGREEIAPAFEAVSDLPMIDGGGAQARIVMGSLWGSRAPTTTYAETIYAEIALAPGGSIPIEAEADERAVMLVGGEAFTTRRYVWWNFASSDRERIEQAKADWREGRFGTVPGDEEEFIPLPDVPITVSYP
jgi:redox-sensitive bicupin YhaK (pirin superfamily)